MGAQPDTSTSAPEVWHGVPQILAPIFVARLLDTYLVKSEGAAILATSSESRLLRLEPGVRLSHLALGLSQARNFLFRMPGELLIGVGGLQGRRRQHVGPPAFWPHRA